MTRLPLTRLPSELSRLSPGRPVPSYRQLYNQVLSARIPAEQDANGRWSVDEAQVLAIAVQLGLVDPPAPRSRRRTASALVAA